jgi:beta-glucanase (GH16 family)
MPTGDPAGWRRVLSDDFAGTRLSSRWVAYDGEPSGDPAGWFDPAHVTVSGGVLTIRGAYQAARRKWVTGAVSSWPSLKQAYGKYEVRFRADKGRGIAYALLLWPVDGSWPPGIDFAADNGDTRSRLYTTLHTVGGSQIEKSTDADFSEWHVAGVEWTPGRLDYTLDGTVWATVRDPWVPAEPMVLALQSQAWACGQTWRRCPDSTTPAQVNLQVDWVVAYARRAP